MADALKIKVIIGTTREGRFGDKPARWIFDLLKKKEGVEAELLDLRDYPMPFFNEPASPNSKKEPYTEPAVVAWTKKVAEADGFVIMAAEYNHGYPAVLKNAIDYVGPEWHDKAVGFVSYGTVGGTRAVEQLRELMVELQMAPIRNAMHLPVDVLIANSKNVPESEMFTAYADKGNGMLDQLITWSRTLRPLRA